MNWLLISLFVLLCPQVLGEVVTITTAKYFTEVNAKFLSVSIDASIVARDFRRPDLTSAKLMTAAKGLTGHSKTPNIYLRVGGSKEDFVVYEPKGLDSLPQYVLNNTEWRLLNSFVKKLDWKLIFGLNVLTRRKSDGSWDPTEFIELLRYSKSQGYKLDFELGNEPDLFPHVNRSIAPDQLARDFALLKVVMESEGDPTSLLIGPDIATLNRYNYFERFLKNVKNNVLDAVSYHFYYGASHNATLFNFTDAAYLDRFLKYGSTAKQLIKSIALFQDIPVWIGETSSTYGGGSPELGMSYVAGFLFLDKLGLAAQMNISVLVKQSLVGGHYSLLDKSFNPTPSYWIAALHKQLVGKRVLNISGFLEYGRNLRFYAHCVNAEGGHGYDVSAVVVFGVNLDQNSTAMVSFGDQMMELPIDQFLLTTGNGFLTDRSIKLNGKILQITGPTGVPDLEPIRVKQPFNFPPLSYGYFVLPDAKADGCMSNET